MAESPRTETPDDWAETTLGDVLEYLRNGTTATQTSDITPYPVSRIETIWNGYIDWNRVGFLENADNRHKMRKGDILYSHINSVTHMGKVALYEDDYPLYHGMNLMLLRPSQARVRPRFLHAVLASERARSYARRECKSAINQASLSQADIKNLPLALPPLSEQQKVIEVFDTLDDAIRKTEQLIAKLEKVKQGLLHDLLTRGIDENGELRDPVRHPEQFKESVLGRIPREWRVRPLEALIQVQLGFAFQSSNYVSNGVLNFRVANIGRTPTDIGERVFLPEPFLKLYPRQQLIGGEIVIVMVGATTGKLGRVPPEICPALQNQNMWNLVPGDGINREFLWYMLPNAVERHLALAQGSARDFLTQHEFLATKCAYPSLVEQENIATHIAPIDSRLHNEGNSLNKLRLLKQGLMEDLLTGRVRVTPLLSETDP